ncbi:MAG: hypothetical protein AB1793_02075 [Candidatus Thermoplasmatota archaeon]
MNAPKTWNLDKLAQIYGLKRHLAPGDYDAIVRKIAKPDELIKLKELEHSLDAEDEFMLISQLLGKCDSINKIDQRKFRSTKRSIAPDLIATYAKDSTTADDSEDRITIFVEIKTCRSEVWKISQSDFDNRRRYASINNLPLWFAIRFELYNMEAWCLLPADYIAGNNRRVHLARIWNSPFDLILGNMNINLMDLTSVTVWEKSTEETSIVNRDWGNLVKTTIEFGGKEYEFLGNDPRAWMFRHFMSEKVSVETNGTRTIVRERYQRQFKCLYKLMMEFAQRTQSSPQERTASSVYDKIVTDNALSIAKPEFFMIVLTELEKLGFILTFIWDPEPRTDEPTMSR